MPPPLPLNSPAPAFSTKSLTGTAVTLQSLRGHVVLLDYWATWCGPCRMEMPTLEKLYRRYSSRGLRVVGISMDDPTTAAKVRPYIRKMHITYTICVDPAANARAASKYNAQDTPSSYLIDKHGVVRWAEAGFALDDGRRLSRLIRRLSAG